MNKELDKKLCDKYPVIFRERCLSMSQTAMCWGIQSDDGWWELIDDLCAQLDLIHRKFGVATVATTVKEKYGGLRFYTHQELDKGRKETADDKVILDILDAVVSQAEAISYSRCEICGDFGYMHMKGSWYKTLCSDHGKQEGYVPAGDYGEEADNAKQEPEKGTGQPDQESS